MLHQFRHFYPQGSLISELINIDRGLYIIKVTIQNNQIILGTAHAAAETIEKAEDRARERALTVLNLEKLGKSANQASNTAVESVASSNSAKKTPIVTNSYQDAPSFTVQNTSSKTDDSNNQQTSPEPIDKPVEEDFMIDTNTMEAASEVSSPAPKASVSEPQINIFDQPISTPVEKASPEDTTNTIEFDFNDIKHKIDLEMKRLSWTKEQGRDYLLSTYGKRSRLHLSDPELLEFLEYLENLPN